jgi:hypothetical protein
MTNVFHVRIKNVPSVPFKNVSSASLTILSLIQIIINANYVETIILIVSSAVPKISVISVFLKNIQKTGNANYVLILIEIAKSARMMENVLNAQLPVI